MLLTLPSLENIDSAVVVLSLPMSIMQKPVSGWCGRKRHSTRIFELYLSVQMSYHELWLMIGNRGAINENHST